MGTSAAYTTTAEDPLLTSTIILAFSFLAIGPVSYMLSKRLRELKSKARTTFRFLVLLEAIKVQKTTFDKSLHGIEQYLTIGDWTMADY